MVKAPENFAENVRYACHQRRLGQDELVHELDLSFSTINRWENSKTKLARKQFKAFCERINKQGS